MITKPIKTAPVRSIKRPVTKPPSTPLSLENPPFTPWNGIYFRSDNQDAALTTGDAPATVGDEIHGIATSMNRFEDGQARLATAISEKGRISGGLIVSVIAALATWSVALCAGVWFLVGLGHEPTEVRLQALIDDYKDHQDNHGHPIMVAEMEGVKQQVKTAQVQHDSHERRIERMEEWYNGHGQRMAQDIIRVESLVSGLEPRVEANSNDLASRAGQRFNRPEGEAMEARLTKQIDDLESRVREDYPPPWLIEDVRNLQAMVIEIVKSRFDPTDAEKLLDGINRDIDRLEKNDGS